MLELEKYLRKEGDPDIVGHLELELYIRKDFGENRKVLLPIGPESRDITFKELGDIAFEYYYEKYDSDETYGFAYKIIEKEV